MRWQWGFVALASAALSVFAAGDAVAMCGCMVPIRPANAPVEEQNALLNKATVVVMLREGTHTVLSFQNDYFGPAEDFGLVVPVPVVLHDEDVSTLDRGMFDRVQAVAAPHMVELYEQNPCPAPPSTGRGMNDALGGLAARGGGAGAAQSEGGAMRPPVVVEEQFSEGEYDISILGASDSTALEQWLNDNGYRLPRGSARYLRPYVQAGMKFFVARVDIGRLRQIAAHRQRVLRQQRWMSPALRQLLRGPPADIATSAQLGRFLSPLRMHYESEEFALPVRLGLINSTGEQDLIVHILSTEGRYEVANYGNRWVPTNVHVNGRAAQNFGRFYDALFGTLSARAPRRVWTEYAGPITPIQAPPQMQGGGLGMFGMPARARPAGGRGGPVGCIGCSRPGLSATDLRALGEEIVHPGDGDRIDEYTLTRLHYRYGQRGLPNDLVFRQGRAMAGGVEPATDRRLRRRPRRAERNDYRVRFVAQHRWAGAVRCENPRRGNWGGRPSFGGVYRESEEREWPEDRPIPLGGWIRDSVPQLGIRGR